MNDSEVNFSGKDNFSEPQQNTNPLPKEDNPTSLINTPPEETSTTQQIPNSFPEETSPTPPQDTQPQPAFNKETKQPQKPTKDNKKILIISIILATIILLGGITAGIFFYLSSQNTQDQSQQAEEENLSNEEKLTKFSDDFHAATTSDDKNVSFEKLEAEMKEFIKENEVTDQVAATDAKDYLAQFYMETNRPDDAIVILEEELSKTPNPQREYVVYTRLIKAYEQKNDKENQKKYIEKLLSMENPHPKYESWDAIIEVYQAKLAELEKQ